MPQSVTFDLPFPPSVNQYWRHAMIHGSPRTLLSARGRQYRDDVAAAVWERFGAISPAKFRVRVAIELHPPDARKRDLDNYFKGALDGLTACGFWADDELIDDLRIVRREAHRPRGKLVVTVEEIVDRESLF